MAHSHSYLNPDLKSPKAQDFEDRLGDLIVGQDRALRRMTGLYQIYQGLSFITLLAGNGQLFADCEEFYTRSLNRF